MPENGLKIRASKTQYESVSKIQHRRSETVIADLRYEDDAILKDWFASHLPSAVVILSRN